MSLAGIPTNPGRHPRRTSLFGRWRRGLVTMAILLLDRWLQPLPPSPTLPSATLSTPTSFGLVRSACHRYDEPIAHSEKIFNHVSRTRLATMVVSMNIGGSGGENRIAPLPNGNEGRWRWRSNRPLPLLPRLLPLQSTME